MVTMIFGISVSFAKAVRNHSVVLPVLSIFNCPEFGNDKMAVLVDVMKDAMQTAGIDADEVKAESTEVKKASLN